MIYLLTLLFVLGAAPTTNSSDTLTPAIVGIIGVAVGSLIGVAGNVGATLISNNKQMEREKLTHELARQTAEQTHQWEVEAERQKRLRQLYAKVLYAALTLQRRLADAYDILGAGFADKEGQAKQIELEKAMIDWELARVDLILEGIGKHVPGIVNDTHAVFLDYTQIIKKDLREHFKSRADRTKIDIAVDTLKAALSDEIAPPTHI